MKQKNYWVALILSFCTVTGAFAQFSVGAELALPMGTFGDAYNLGFGGSAAYEASISDNLSWTGYFGFQTYSIKSTIASSGSFTMIPVMGGIKYYFTESGKGFYGEADLGIFFASASAGGASASESKFGITPAVGYRTGNWDLGARFNLPSNANNLAFRVAYVFGSK
jgi:hypothetical protein